MSASKGKPKKFNILTVSDEVVDFIYSPAVKERFAGVNLVLSCGDLPFYYLEFIVDMLNVPLYYVFGNHDRRAEYSSYGPAKTSPGGCINVDGRIINHKGLLIGGLEGSMKYSHEDRYQYTEFEMRLKALRLLPCLFFNRLRFGRYIDILITHAPPYKIHNGKDLCHQGFKTFRWFIESFRPKYLIHGHHHVYGLGKSAFTVYQGTQVVNTFGYRVLEVEV